MSRRITDADWAMAASAALASFALQSYLVGHAASQKQNMSEPRPIGATNVAPPTGSLGAAIGLMMWMWRSAVIVLCGAELNSEIEHQTAVDTTVGPGRPMGQRSATMADTLSVAPSLSNNEQQIDTFGHPSG